MSHPAPGLTVHMVVKNDDRFVWYALTAILPFVDHILVTDTGSTDHTRAIMKTFKSSKIAFNSLNIASPRDLVDIRRRQLQATQTPWFWVVDADDIYPERTIQEILGHLQSTTKLIVVRRYDLVGDIYHQVPESVGAYRLFGEVGHLTTRLFNRQALGPLTLKGDYPYEGFYTQDGKHTQETPVESVYLTTNRYWHASYLIRSSQGSNLAATLHRRKFKVELGDTIHEPIPEVFAAQRPSLVPSVTQPRSLPYTLAAAFITPVKQLKRRLISS